MVLRRLNIGIRLGLVLAAEFRELVRAFEISDSIDYLDSQLAPLARSVTEQVEGLVAFQVQRINEASDEADATYTTARNTMIGSILIFALIMAAASWRLTVSIITPIRRSVQVANRIADNDLTETINADGNDEATEMLKALSRMQDNLGNVMAQISSSADQLASSSEELSAVTNDSSDGLQRQNEELEQAASAVTELTVAIEEVANTASSTANVSNEADTETTSGYDKVSRTVEAIQQMVDDLEDNAKSTTELAQRVTEVASVLDVIRNIAEQTNLLALNAAIEAARAGEHGRGFAVVADEVRSLAQRTAESTKEIEGIISAVEAGTDRTVTQMQSSKETASDTLTVGREAGEALKSIASLISRINEQNASTASATEQQANTAREVDKNLTTIRDIATQAAAGAEQTTASSQELARLAEGLSDLVSRFELKA